MALIGSMFAWLMKKRMHQIELFVKYPHDVQSEWFKRLIAGGKDTEWGKRYDYESIRNPVVFRERVPVSDYDALKPFIERLRQGEQKVLWGSDIRWFAKSSGTTSDKSKFIPVSQEALEECHYKGGKDLLSIYCNLYPDTEVFEGKGLAMGGSHQISEVSNDLFYGDLSAILMQNLPWWAEFMRTPDLSIALMGEWEEKIEKMAEVTSRHNVTSLSGVPSWTLLLVRRVMELHGVSNILEVWPQLEVFFHGGVSFDPYREQFRQLCEGRMNFVETYNASEGFFGIQDKREPGEMLLMLDYGIYYEFMPMEELGKESPHCIGLDQVVTGKDYAMVITTNAGLWRYLIGDTVRFTCTDPYRIRITGRTRNFINAVGEELIIDNAEKALAIACSKSNAIIREYTAAPFHPEHGSVRHQWLIEFEQSPENLEYFLEIFDNALKSNNSDYEAKRYRNMVLDPPELIVMPRDAFYRWLKWKGKLGGQHKVPRLSNQRNIVEEVLRLNT
jgi:hypothetical protein